jgi:hypothetical protein
MEEVKAYADTATARLIHNLLSKVVVGRDVMATAAGWAAMVRSVRNLRRPGIDLPGLRFLQDRAPVGTEIAAGEYGYEPGYFRRMLAAGAVDVLHAKATRCGGINGLLQTAALCQLFFDGVHPPVDGVLWPDLSRPGMGVELKRADARSFAA